MLRFSLRFKQTIILTGMALTMVFICCGCITSKPKFLQTLPSQYDDSKLAPHGLEKACQIPKLPFFNVKVYGAKGDGKTDDTASIQKAIDAAEGVNGGIIFFPEGTYAVALDADSSNDKKPQVIFQITSSNLVFLGEGPDKSHLSGYMPGLQDPVTHWNVTQDSYLKIKRFGMFKILSSKYNEINNIQFRSLDITGNAGYTGNFTVGGIRSTGNGWDMSHKAIAIHGPEPINNVLIFNCAIHHWRGEVVWGSFDGSIKIINDRIFSSNASAISISADVFISHTVVGGENPGEDVYNGVENFATKNGQDTVIRDSKFMCSSLPPARRHGNGIVYQGVESAYLLIERTQILRNQYGILLSEGARHVTIRESVFSENVHAVIDSHLGLYKNFKGGFGDISIKNNIFSNSGTVYIHQGSREIHDFILRNNTVRNGSVLGGGFNGTAWRNFIVDKTVLEGKAKDINGYKGNVAALWTNTVRHDANHSSAGVSIGYSEKKVIAKNPPALSELVIHPLTDQTVMKPYPKSVYLIVDPAVLTSYPVGFQTTILAEPKSQWILKADPSWNVFEKDIPVTQDGITIRFNSQRLFEQVK